LWKKQQKVSIFFKILSPFLTVGILLNLNTKPLLKLLATSIHFTIHVSSIPQPNVVYEYPPGVVNEYPSVALYGGVISLPVGIALVALERIKATRSLVS